MVNLHSTRSKDEAGIEIFKVVIVYEDLARAIRARDLSDRLAAQLQPPIEITSEMWKFDFLRYTDLREEAVSAAEAGDMIIISARSAAQLPVHVRTWIESWMSRKRYSPAAFVALLDQEEDIPGEPPSFCDYLRQIAEKARMDFFLKTSGWRQPSYQFAVETFRKGVKPGIVKWVAGIADCVSEFWGWLD